MKLLLVTVYLNIYVQFESMNLNYENINFVIGNLKKKGRVPYLYEIVHT